MTSNSESAEQALSSVDSNCFPSPKCKTSLRLRLSRVFVSGAQKSPKSPKSVSSSRGSSPTRGSPHAKTRYSWQPGTFASEENRSPCTPESGVSTLSSSSLSSSSSSSKSPLATNTPKSPSTPTKSMYFSTWYTGERRLADLKPQRGVRQKDMKYSPQQQQQQQKQRKSESDAASVDATLSRTSRRPSSSTERKGSSASSTRAVCRSPSTGMFAWMRVFRLASMLHQVGC